MQRIVGLLACVLIVVILWANVAAMRARLVHERQAGYREAIKKTSAMYDQHLVQQLKILKADEEALAEISHLQGPQRLKQLEKAFYDSTEQRLAVIGHGSLELSDKFR